MPFILRMLQPLVNQVGKRIKACTLRSSICKRYHGRRNKCCASILKTKVRSTELDLSGTKSRQDYAPRRSRSLRIRLIDMCNNRNEQIIHSAKIFYSNSGVTFIEIRSFSLPRFDTQVTKLGELHMYYTMDFLPLWAAWPIGWFLQSVLLFFVALQQSSLLRKRGLGILHTLAVGCTLSTEPRVLAALPPFLVPFIIGVTVHTSSILLLDRRTALTLLPLPQRLRRAIPLWGNLRRLENHGGSADSAKSSPTDRLLFGTGKIVGALVLWLVDRGITKLFVNRLLRSLSISVHDFAPDKRGLLPEFEEHQLILRGVMSVHWIWSSYCGLTSAHNLCAVLFVTLLGWDRPADWPPLYGSVLQAHSLRRFWGVFWHRLHIAPFAAYTPKYLDLSRLTRGSNIAQKALCSLWIFLLSAACHALANMSLHRRPRITTEVRFFFSNWIVCLIETTMRHAVNGTLLDFRADSPYFAIRGARRLLGYAFLWAFFMCTVPAWQYPLVYDLIMQRSGAGS
jgi:hypothetical protein